MDRKKKGVPYLPRRVPSYVGLSGLYIIRHLFLLFIHNEHGLYALLGLGSRL